MEYKYNQLNILQKLSNLLLIVVCFLQVQGFIRVENLALMIFAGWLFVSILAYPNILANFIKERRFVLLLLFIVFYFISSSFAVSVSISFNRCVAFLSVASPALMYEIVKHQNAKFKIFILLMFLTVFLGNIYASYTFLDAIGATNLRQSSHDYRQEFYIVGVIFNMCYTFAIIVPCIVDIYKRMSYRNAIIFKFILIIIALFFTIYLLRAQYMTAILITILGSVFIYYYKNKKSIVKLTIVFACIIFAFIEFFPLFVSQFNRSGDFSEMTYRMNEIYLSLTGKKHEAWEIITRQKLSAMSVSTFFENPIFGVNYKVTPDYHPNYYGIGDHASWPDSLANYGLFAIFLFIYIWDSLKKQRKELNTIAPSVTLMIIGLLNPVLFFPQICAALFIMPLAYNLLGNKNTCIN